VTYKEVAGESAVSAHSTELKVAVFSATGEGLVSADSKGFMGASCVPIGRQFGTPRLRGECAWFAGHGRNVPTQRDHH